MGEKSGGGMGWGGMRKNLKTQGHKLLTDDLDHATRPEGHHSEQKSLNYHTIIHDTIEYLLLTLEYH